MPIDVIKRDQLPWRDTAHELVGADHGLDITLLFVEAATGEGPALRTASTSWSPPRRPQSSSPGAT
jgi:hypothetical protein